VKLELQNSRDERQVGSGEAFDFGVVDDGVECVFLPIVTASVNALLADARTGRGSWSE
jgi:hypothetical protein